MSDTGFERLKVLLERQGTDSLLPELGTVSLSEQARTPHGKAILEWARQAAKTQPIPETTYTLYREFLRSGVRPPYEKPYFDKRALLTQEAIAAWLDNDDTRIDRINDLIWNICEETTWVLPAHEKTPWTIDLFAAETGVELAHVLLLLGDRLPEEIRNRIHAEVDKRILDLYLKHAVEYWWNAGRNNWTGVCAGAIGQTALLLEDDADRQAQIIALVLAQLRRFIDNAFEQDGGCLEGIGYWNYGLLHYVGFAEMLRARTDGAIDLLAEEKVRAIARYPLAVNMGPGTYASFADSHEHSSLVPLLAARLGERAGATELRALVGSPVGWRLTSVLRNLLWWDGSVPAAAPLEDAFLPVSGIARLVDNACDRPFILVIKAGSNGEPHNHNDVGSFVLRVGERTYLCDPGGGLYNKDYFGPKRYDNVFASSYGHSVPRIGGTLQSPGETYRGTLERTETHAVRVSFPGAYDLANLKQAVRVVTLEDGHMTLEDTFGFDGAALDVEEAFVTWEAVELGDGVARVRTDQGTLEIRANGASFAAERLEDACKANLKDGVLTRLTVQYPAAPRIEARFTMTYVPTRP